MQQYIIAMDFTAEGCVIAMEATAAGCVILNAVKDLTRVSNKILHHAQDDTTTGSSLHSNDKRYFHSDFHAGTLAQKTMKQFVVVDAHIDMVLVVTVIPAFIIGIL